MKQENLGEKGNRRSLLRRWLMLSLALVVMVGCEVNSFMDPSVVGRWEHTPVTLPILDRLDVIDEPIRGPQDITGVRAEDHLPDPREYVLGAGDMITVTIFELIDPGQDWVGTRRIDEIGTIRLPVIGSVRASDRSPSQLEEHIADVLEDEGILMDADVAVIIQEARQNTFSVLGEPTTGGTAVGTYEIPRPEFRLLDALSMARGAPGRTKTLQIYRQTPLTDEAAGRLPDEAEELPDELEGEPGEDPGDLIDELMRGVEEDDEDAQPQPQDQTNDRPAAPAGVERALEDDAQRSQWVNVEGEWVRTEPDAPVSGRRRRQDVDLEELSELITQRIIEIPYQELLEGDMRYNIVIRPGDVIRVPAPSAGFVYIGGEINRPGAYTVPGERDLTLKQLIFSAGNLGQIAIPERVDLTRRIGDDHEATVRIDVRAIFEGREPDIFLRPNDTVNIGTSFPATPLAIIRNGFRATYGFGFIFDRNFAQDVFD